MNEFQATAVMVALFALRCVVPLLLTMLLGYLMNRLVDRWEAEEAEKATVQEREKSGAPSIAPQPAPTLSRPAISLPAIDVDLPCWLVKGCESSRRADCPAYRQRDKPCWLARLQFEGVLPANCPDCPIYQQAHA